MVLLVLVLLFLASPGGSALAQASASPLELDVFEPEGTIEVRLGDLLGDPSLQEALHSGLPLRIEVVTELWKDGFFDGLEGRDQWRVTVVVDPLVEDYVLRVGDESAEAIRYATLDELRSGFPRLLEPPLEPREQGRHYYTGRISVETLSLSDLEELRRWLRGELAGAISGDAEVEGAVERGLRRTVVRLLGLPFREFETRTPTFEFR